MSLTYRYSESTVKPEPVEIGKTTVFLRTDIEKETRTVSDGNTTDFWTYQEAKMTPEEFVAYANILSSRDIITGVSNSNQLIIMEAIADLYDKISNIQKGASS